MKTARSTSDTAEERSYMSCPDIAACFNSAHTKKMVDYAWRPVTDSKLLGFPWWCGSQEERLVPI